MSANLFLRSPFTSIVPFRYRSVYWHKRKCSRTHPCPFYIFVESQRQKIHGQEMTQPSLSLLLPVFVVRPPLCCALDSELHHLTSFRRVMVGCLFLYTNECYSVSIRYGISRFSCVWRRRCHHLMVRFFLSLFPLIRHTNPALARDPGSFRTASFSPHLRIQPLQTPQ
jgi:hypothetical protein